MESWQTLIAGDVVGVAQSSYNISTGQFSPMDTLGFVPTIGWGMGAMGRYGGVRASSRIVGAASEGRPTSLLHVSSLNKRQLAVHESLLESGATGVFRKKSVSMADLRAVGRVTGDEYSAFTQRGRRFIIRGYGNEIRVTPGMASDLAAGRYGRWSGHTHPPGYSINPSTVDRSFIPQGQTRSAVWGDAGYEVFHRTTMDDLIYEREIQSELMRRFYDNQ